MKSSYILSIATPCHESWEEMTPTEKGRFCQQCQKTVTDFSALSDSQMIELLKSKQASACGRFTASQLNRVITAPVPEKYRKPFISIAAVVAALTIAIPAVKAAAYINKVEQTTNKESEPIACDFALEGSTGFVSGIVKADKDNLVLPGATIKIKGTTTGTITDESGYFRLSIPHDFRKKVMILEVSSIGYERKSIKVRLKGDIRPLDIRMYENTVMLGGYGVHFINDDKKEESLWEKFSGTVRNIFS